MFELLSTLGVLIGRWQPIGARLLIVCDYVGFRFLESLKIINYCTPERLIKDIERLDCYFFHCFLVYARPFRSGRGY